MPVFDVYWRRFLERRARALYGGENGRGGGAGRSLFLQLFAEPVVGDGGGGGGGGGARYRGSRTAEREAKKGLSNKKDR